MSTTDCMASIASVVLGQMSQRTSSKPNSASDMMKSATSAVVPVTGFAMGSDSASIDPEYGSGTTVYRSKVRPRVLGSRPSAAQAASS
jgi:hypothetical protein